MATPVRNVHPRGLTTLDVVTRYTPENGYLAGRLHIAKGWHWWFQAANPVEGARDPLSAVMRGPFATEEEALRDADSRMAAARPEQPSGSPVYVTSVDGVDSSVSCLDWRDDLETVTQVFAQLVSAHGLELLVEQSGSTVALAVRRRAD